MATRINPLTTLANARAVRDEYTQEVKDIQDELEASSLYQVLLGKKERLKVAEEDVKSWETTIRNARISEYEETDEKQLEGGSIAVRSSLDYEEEKAFAWAKENNLALKLDKRSFEKLYKTGEFNIPFVKTVETPTFRINSDLSEYVSKFLQEQPSEDRENDQSN